MREAIGGAWILSLVVVFILIFAAYLAISINYSKAFHIKDAVVSIIEKNEGHCGADASDGSRALIAEYLAAEGYRVFGNCRGDEEVHLAESTNPGRGMYCLERVETTQTHWPTRPSPTLIPPDQRVSTGYYRITLFFRFDLPLLGNILTFRVPGETGMITHFPAANC